ncbi:KleE stable inheritance protein [Pseudomonas helleri]|uniref:KleE stable inheritance protein n=1 Tax=Pseudomonas helleri TaxID=1608996 RepID=UPI003FD44B71
MVDNVYKFPSQVSADLKPVSVSEVENITPTKKPKKMAKKAFFQVVSVLWFLVALVWPLLRWLLALDVVYQGFLMIFNWSNPESHAGWVFFLHFAVLVAFTIFVTSGKPERSE